MAIAEDPASVLELFVHDVANLPAEIAHLYEEMQAKDQQIIECRSIIGSRDSSMQKFIRLNGSLVKNPKEEPYGKTIAQSFDKAQVLQEEKIALSEKAAALLDRHIKRLDIKIRDLQSEGSLPSDPTLPSLLRDSPGNIVPPASLTTTGANTPLHPLSGNTSGGTANIANAAIARIANAAASGRMNSPSIMAMQPHPLLTSAHLANAQAMAGGGASRQREMSVGSEAKRRRLNTNQPATSSGLARSASIGPGTPKATTPGGSRAGSVGPRPMKKGVTTVGGNRRMGPGMGSQQGQGSGLRKKVSKAGLQKKSARRLMSGGGSSSNGGGGSRASPSTTADEESALSEADGSEDEQGSANGGEGNEQDEGGDVDDEGDDTKYCMCQRVSFGDMIACDNENCKYQWFHWECVGMKKEPDGDWLCPECRTLDKKLIKKAR